MDETERAAKELPETGEADGDDHFWYCYKQDTGCGAAYHAPARYQIVDCPTCGGSMIRLDQLREWVRELAVGHIKGPDGRSRPWAPAPSQRWGGMVEKTPDGTIILE